MSDRTIAEQAAELAAADISFEMRRPEIPDNPGVLGPPTWWVNDRRVSRQLFDAVVGIVQARREQECAKDGHRIPEPRCTRCGHRP